MPQHEDPLVFNADRGLWQNASNPGPSLIPAGLSIGTPGGSRVRLAPTVGNTIQVDGGATATIEAAVQLQSGAATEVQPGHVSSVVFHQGAANEQIGTLTVSAMANSTAQATLLTSDSADGTIKGAAKTGTITPGSTTTWAFTTAHQVLPSAQSVQVGQGYNINATDPRNAAIPEDWHSIGIGGSGMGGNLNYIVIPVGNGSLVALAWFFTHNNGTTTSDDTLVCSLPNAYAPTSGWRIAAACDQLKVSNSIFEGAHLRILAGSGDCKVWGIGTTATFHAGSGVYPLGI